jgi:hypothetical protein
MEVENYFGTHYCCRVSDAQAATMRETRWWELGKEAKEERPAEDGPQKGTLNACNPTITPLHHQVK